MVYLMIQAKAISMILQPSWVIVPCNVMRLACCLSIARVMIHEKIDWHILTYWQSARTHVHCCIYCTTLYLPSHSRAGVSDWQFYIQQRVCAIVEALPHFRLAGCHSFASDGFLSNAGFAAAFEVSHHTFSASDRRPRAHRLSKHKHTNIQ